MSIFTNFDWFFEFLCFNSLWFWWMHIRICSMQRCSLQFITPFLISVTRTFNKFTCYIHITLSNYKCCAQLMPIQLKTVAPLYSTEEIITGRRLAYHCVHYHLTWHFPPIVAVCCKQVQFEFLFLGSGENGWTLWWRWFHSYGWHWPNTTGWIVENNRSQETHFQACTSKHCQFPIVTIYSKVESP